MRIENSNMQLAGASTSVELHSKQESAKIWTDKTRLNYENNESTAIVKASISVENSAYGDNLKLSPEGKAALGKQLATASAGTVDKDDFTDLLSDTDKQKIIMLQKMIENLTGRRFRFVMPKGIRLMMRNIPESAGNRPATNQNVQQNNGWGFEYDLQESHYEKQTMSFAAKGTVKTADGREINLDLSLNMSREFASQLNISVRAGDAAVVDPLVINYGAASANLTNNKFSFDIDSDGVADMISFATGGSGFLAYDINGDGIINDGSELFGTKSGNGFEDLALHDEDGNGWIDENDSIYDKLRIWTKDEEGNDQLFALGVVGIGAIYLGNVNTAYDVKTSANDTLGSIARTGVFLRENGLAGTIQHVDLAV